MAHASQKTSTNVMLYTAAAILGFGAFAMAVGNLLTTVRPGTLEISNVALSPSNPKPGDTITFNITVSNPKTQIATNAKLYVDWNGDDKGYALGANLPRIPGRTGVTVSLSRQFGEGDFAIFLQARRSGWKTTTAKFTFSTKIAQPPVAPTVKLQSDTTSVNQAMPAILTWTSTNATNCVASDGWIGPKATVNMSPGETVYPSDQGTRYTLTCTGVGGSATDSIFVEVKKPRVGESPDLIISEPVTWTNPCDGSSCSYKPNITIKNIGGAKAAFPSMGAGYRLKISVRDITTSDPRVIVIQDVPVNQRTLDIGQVIVLNQALSIPSTYAGKLVKFLIDSDDAVYETDEGNNERTETVPGGSAQKPDLLISRVRWQNTASGWQAILTVSNNGNAGATCSHDYSSNAYGIGLLEFFSGRSVNTFIECPGNTFPANQSYDILMSNLTFPSGTEVIFTIDYQKRIDESSELNNEYKSSSPSQMLSDLTVSDAKWSLKNTLWSPNIMVNNKGGGVAQCIPNPAGSGYIIGLKATFSGSTVNTYVMCPSDKVAVGQSYEVQMSSIVAPSKTSVSFVIDPNNNISESDETNNTYLSTTPDVPNQNYPDLVLKFSRWDYNPAEGYRPMFTVTNQGTENVLSSIKDIQVMLYGTIDNKYTQQLLTLKSNAQVVAGSSFESYLWNGTQYIYFSSASLSAYNGKTFTLVLDPNNMITESSKSNNNFAWLINVLPPAPPLSTSCSVSPNPGKLNQSVTFTAQPSGGSPAYTYLWSGACTSTSQTCIKTFNTLGQVTATLTVSDSQGKTAQTSCPVQINAVCGDGICSSTENSQTCPSDCRELPGGFPGGIN